MLSFLSQNMTDTYTYKVHANMDIIIHTSQNIKSYTYTSPPQNKYVQHIQQVYTIKNASM